MGSVARSAAGVAAALGALAAVAVPRALAEPLRLERLRTLGETDPADTERWLWGGPGGRLLRDREGRALAVDGTVFLLSDKGLYRVRVADGAMLWRTAARRALVSDDAVGELSGDRLASSDGRLAAAVSVRTGKITDRVLLPLSSMARNGRAVALAPFGWRRPSRASLCDGTAAAVLPPRDGKPARLIARDLTATRSGDDPFGEWRGADLPSGNADGSGDDNDKPTLAAVGSAAAIVRSGPSALSAFGPPPDGGAVWRKRFDLRPDDPAISAAFAGRMLIVGTASGAGDAHHPTALAGVDGEGRTAWTLAAGKDLGGSATAAPAWVGAEGLLVLGGRVGRADEGRLAWLDPATGKARWQAETATIGDESPRVFWAARERGGRILLVTSAASEEAGEGGAEGDGEKERNPGREAALSLPTIVCLDAATGRVLWRVPLETERDALRTVGAPTLSDDGRRVAVAVTEPMSGAATACVIDAATGRLLLRGLEIAGPADPDDGPRPILPPPAVVMCGNYLVAETPEGVAVWRPGERAKPR
jgi:outer membrane protein assembly factor BamB